MKKTRKGQYKFYIFIYAYLQSIGAHRNTYKALEHIGIINIQTWHIERRAT